MSTRRIAYWWFRLVFSGRFLETFLVGRHAPSTAVRGPETAKPQHDAPLSSSDAAAGVAAE